MAGVCRGCGPSSKVSATTRSSVDIQRRRKGEKALTVIVKKWSSNIVNKNIALSREKLISEVWGYDFYGDARTLDTHIKLLRKSLGRYSDCIVTLRGVGYRFDTGKIL